MNSSRRVRNLETLACRIRPPADSHEYDEDEWLVLFEQYYESGHAANEPDYPIALDCYRTALAAAHRHGFDPPRASCPRSRIVAVARGRGGRESDTPTSRRAGTG